MARFEFVSPALKGYFYDSVEDRIYSTKRKGEPYPIKWCQPNPRGPVIAQLVDLSGEKIRMNKFEIKYLIRHNPMDSNIYEDYCKQDIQATSAAYQAASATLDTYIFVVIENGRLKPSSEPKIHCTLADAKAKAERLARSLPGLKVRVFKDCGTVEARGVVWS